MLMTIGADALRKALADIEAAERNGFMYCLAVLNMKDQIDGNLELGYSDLWERAHPHDGRLNWGRFQRVSQRHRFDGAKLVPLESPQADDAVDPHVTDTGKPTTRD